MKVVGQGLNIALHRYEEGGGGVEREMESEGSRRYHLSPNKVECLLRSQERKLNWGAGAVKQAPEVGVMGSGGMFPKALILLLLEIGLSLFL